jgi:hypothetical protein
MGIELYESIFRNAGLRLSFKGGRMFGKVLQGYIKARDMGAGPYSDLGWNNQEAAVAKPLWSKNG